MSEPFDDLLNEIPDRFIVAHENIDSELLTDFYACLSGIEKKVADIEIEEKALHLFDSDQSISTKKTILVELADIGTISAYRQIETYFRTADDSIREWAKIALYECQRKVESDLVEEKSGIISTGLGGKNNCIRYVFIVKSNYNLLVYGETIKKEWSEIIQKNRSVIEDIEVKKNYIQLLCLAPIDIAIGTIIEDGIKKINTVWKNILSMDYMVLNTRIPTREEIEQFINEDEV